MTPALIHALLSSRMTLTFSRVLLTMMFWTSGLAKLFDFPTAITEMNQYSLYPAAPIALAVIIVQLLGSALVISGRLVWLGAGALGVFTILTIPIAHNFWAMPVEKAFVEMLFAIEHLSMVGGLLLVSIHHRSAFPAPKVALASAGA